MPRRTKIVRKVVRRRRVKPRRQYKPRPKGNMVTLIKQTVKSMAEVKHSNVDPTNYGFNANNTTCSPAVDLTLALESIGQGANDGSRVGNQIMIKRYDMTMNFYMFPAYISGATFRPGFVHIWIGYLKSDKYGTPNATDLLKLKQDGGNSVGVDQTVLSTLRKDNLDYFTIVAKRKFKLGGSGSPYPNNDFPIQKSIKFKNLLKGKVIYNDASSINNKSLFMWCHFVTVDSVPLTVSIPVLCDYFIECDYIDI